MCEPFSGSHLFKEVVTRYILTFMSLVRGQSSLSQPLEFKFMETDKFM